MRFNPNMMKIIQSLQGGANPQQVVMGMLEGQSQGNPFFQNLLTLAKNGNRNEIEQIARNMFKEKGLDYDKEFNSFKNHLGF